jgi:lysophospholipase L1-like esterase
VNAGINGNTVTRCPTGEAVFGQAAVRRFDRDVLQYRNVRAVIIHEGGNDLRECSWINASDVAEGLEDLTERAHAAGIRVLLGTYVPRVCRITWNAPDPCPDGAGDDQRRALNRWIRAQRGHVAKIIDFDKALRDPDNPGHQAAWTKAPDGVHPGRPGRKAMGNLIPLKPLASAIRRTG